MGGIVSSPVAFGWENDSQPGIVAGLEVLRQNNCWEAKHDDKSEFQKKATATVSPAKRGVHDYRHFGHLQGRECVVAHFGIALDVRKLLGCVA